MNDSNLAVEEIIDIKCDICKMTFYSESEYKDHLNPDGSCQNMTKFKSKPTHTAYHPEKILREKGKAGFMNKRRPKK